jgi:hypothetical protein
MVSHVRAWRERVERNRAREKFNRHRTGISEKYGRSTSGICRQPQSAATAAHISDATITTWSKFSEMRG